MEPEPIRLEELDPFVAVRPCQVGPPGYVIVTILHHVDSPRTGEWYMTQAEYDDMVKQGHAADKCRAETMPEQHQRSILGRAIDPRLNR